MNIIDTAFEGLKIVQISDIHSGSFASEEPFRRAVEMIMNEKPDVIFFTGDLVNDRSSEAERHIATWKQLSAPLGVFSILGNHDYGDYVEWDSKAEKAANLQRLKEIHKEMLMRIQNHGLICQTMNHYNQELGILGSNIQVRNSPFKPSSWLHPSTGTTFQTTPASNPIRLQWRNNCFCFTRPIRRSERPLHPFISGHRLSHITFI
jgi:predicted phosphodiesterase